MAIKGSFSQIIVGGALSKPPEMRYTPTGKPVTSFSIPVNRVWYDSNQEKKTEVTWHNIITWGKVAENCKRFLDKGSVVTIFGRLTPDPQTGNPRVFTRHDGSAGASYEITASQVTFMYVDSQGQETEFNGQTSDSEIPPEDDIPF